MKAIYVICSIVLLLTAYGCKQDSAANISSVTDPASAENGQSTTEQQDNQSVTSGHDYTFLTDKILIYNTVFGAGEGEKDPKKNDWIHLLKSGAYLAGRSKDQTHTGKWSYEPNSQTLFLRPDTQEYNMSEWKVMATDDVVVLVGTSTYGNNATQIQLLKSDVLPQ
jgi:hypothetical protein